MHKYNHQDLITVVIATYNRSNVLRYAIQSVVDQTFENWELLVIGDCCTDDSADVVLSFNNPKISFINLEQNIGEQSGPNNYGMRMAKGEYIAFINHDDLWLPHHLEILYTRINESKSDLVYSLFYPVPVDNKSLSMPLRMNDVHDLVYSSPASTWLFKKSLFSKIGSWKYFREIYDIPSQNWLNRVFKMGNIAVVNEVTVIAMPSGDRINSYKNRDYLENEFYYNKIKSNPEELLKEIYFEQMMLLKRRDRRIYYHLKAFVRNTIIAIFTRMGFRPEAVLFIIKNKKRGGFVDKLRQTRGLPKI